jgi:prepilin-type N-terminal cleavage/methylation domain-containing protein
MTAPLSPLHVAAAAPAPAPSPTWRGQRAVTLVELLVTLSIVVVLVMLAPPLAQLYQRQGAAVTFNALRGAIAYARVRAVTHNATVTLCAGDAGGCAAAGLWQAGAVALRDGEPLRVWTWPRRVSVLGAAAAVQFHGDGRVAADAEVRFVVCAAAHRRALLLLPSGATYRWEPTTCAL